MRLFAHLLITCLVLMLPGCASLSQNNLHVIPKPNKDFVLDMLVVEIQPVNDLTINPKALERVKSRLDEYKICREKDITFITKPSISAPKAAWWSSELRMLHQNHRTLHDTNISDRSLVLFLVNVPGIYLESGKQSVAGLAYDDDNFIVYFGSHSVDVQSSVIIHEIGHIIGLVDRSRREGDPVNPDRPPHCNNEKCVMYWISNRNGRFDELCQRDIQTLIDNPDKPIGD